MVSARNLGSPGAHGRPCGVPVGSSTVHGMAAGGSWGVHGGHLGHLWALNDLSRFGLTTSRRLPADFLHVPGDISNDKETCFSQSFKLKACKVS